MSSISAGTSTTNALVTTGDTTGALVLKTNNGTTALTLNTSQALGVGSSPSYGTSGQVLTSGGSSAAPTWAAAPTTSPAGSTGQVQYNNAGAFGAISSGTSGQVLTSAGAGAAPTWATPSSAMTLISTKTASNSASLEWTGLSGYNNYLIVFNAIRTSTNDDQFFMQLGTGTGPTYQTSNYVWAAATSTGTLTAQNGGGSYLRLAQNVSSDADRPVSGFLNLYNITNNTNLRATGMFSYYYISGSDYAVRSFAGARYGAAVIYTAFKFYFETGNIASGSISVYGISS